MNLCCWQAMGCGTCLVQVRRWGILSFGYGGGGCVDGGGGEGVKGSLAEVVVEEALR